MSDSAKMLSYCALLAVALTTISLALACLATIGVAPIPWMALASGISGLGAGVAWVFTAVAGADWLDCR